MVKFSKVIKLAGDAGAAQGKATGMASSMGAAFVEAGLKFGPLEGGKFGGLDADSVAMLKDAGHAYRSRWAKARGVKGAALAVCEAGGVKGIDIPAGQKVAVDKASAQVRTAWQNFRDDALRAAGYELPVKGGKVGKGANANKGGGEGGGATGLPGSLGGCFERMKHFGMGADVAQALEFCGTTAAGRALLLQAVKTCEAYELWINDPSGFRKTEDAAAKAAKSKAK
jgi:hypothetical protein